jgi:hypothetical protein
MTQYWSMKTFVEWWNIFRADNVIGIDQEGVNADYRTLADAQIQQLLTNTTLADSYTEYKDRVFREFCKWMHVGDLVVIGTGPTTTFNLAGVARVTGDYYYNGLHDPKHLRAVEFLAIPATPRPMQRFSRTSRLELIHETDFHEAICSLII